VNLANGGYKQPQQFFVSVYFMEQLDLIINLDGFNDATQVNFLPVYPLEFPVFPKFYGRAGRGGVYGVIGRTARWVYKIITQAPTARRLPGLSRSSSYFLGWFYGRDVLYRIVQNVRSGIFRERIWDSPVSSTRHAHHK
jgi:hypothetical protein